MFYIEMMCKSIPNLGAVQVGRLLLSGFG